MIHLTDVEFRQIVDYVHHNYGIDLSRKRMLIEARMYSALAEKNLSSFSDYFALVRTPGSGELNAMLNRLTTNHTFFMREERHFEFLKTVILPQQQRQNQGRELRIWSAGCSTGEEAYTAIMVMRDFFGFGPAWDYSILATDISTRVLEAAQKGVYQERSLEFVSPAWKRRYFRQHGEDWELSEEIRKEVIFRQLNLMDSFSFRNPFDLIFCRNVMIYFDQPTKSRLIRKFAAYIKTGGYLFIGHSETIPFEDAAASNLKYVEPSIYRKGTGTCESAQ